LTGVFLALAMATWRVWLPAIALSLVVLGVQCFAAVGAGYELFQGESSAKAQHVAEDFTVDPTLAVATNVVLSTAGFGLFLWFVWDRRRPMNIRSS